MKKKFEVPKEMILGAYRNNHSVRETARILKVNIRTVQTIIDRENKNYKSTKLTDEQHEELIKDLKGHNLTTKDLSYKYGIGNYIIDRYYNAYAKVDGKQRHVRQSNNIYNEDCFEIIDSEEKAYWLGFLLADGYIDINEYKVSLEIGNVDIDHLKKLKMFYDCDYNIRTRERNGHVASSLRVSSKKILSDLIAKGFRTNKTYEMKSVIEEVPEDLRRHFLRGLFEGDGGLAIPKANDCNIYLSGLHKIVKDFTDYFGIDEKRISKKKVTGDKRKFDYHARIDLSGNRQCKRILDELYKDSTIYLDRKYKKYKEHFEGYSYGKPFTI